MANLLKILPIFRLTRDNVCYFSLVRNGSIFWPPWTISLSISECEWSCREKLRHLFVDHHGQFRCLQARRCDCTCSEEWLRVHLLTTMASFSSSFIYNRKRACVTIGVVYCLVLHFIWDRTHHSPNISSTVDMQVHCGKITTLIFLATGVRPLIFVIQPIL